MIRLIREHRWVILIILAFTIYRGLIASFIELGNDEVYYWTYVKYPDLSHFDHPPMLGFFAQIFSLNLFFESELALRLSALFCGIFSTFFIYLIGYELDGKRTALAASILFSTSLYTSLISSTFLMPDNPLIVFWLFSIWAFFRLIRNSDSNSPNLKWMLILSISIGLAILSKYHAAFLLVGLMIYVLLHRRKWLLAVKFYLCLSSILLVILPIILWNIEFGWVSFGFHGDRVGWFDKGIRLDYFSTEVLGQFFYNNPINVAISLISLFLLKNSQRGKIRQEFSYLKWFIWPLIITVLILSLSRRTLPHWTGPAYATFILFAAHYLAHLKLRATKKWAGSSLAFFILITVVGMLDVKQGILSNHLTKQYEKQEKIGKHDVTLDLYGWKQFQKAFEKWHASSDHSQIRTILNQDLYQSAHIDYYVARPMNCKLIAMGDLKSIHKYAWINLERGGLKEGESAFFITHSRAFKKVSDILPYFQEQFPVKKFPIYRNGKIVQYFFVYPLKGYRGNYTFFDPYQLNKKRARKKS